MRVFLNLKAGLDLLGVPYLINDYRHARRHPGELCCILGKRHVLDSERWQNPLMIGPCVHNHPIDDPDLLARLEVRRILVPGEWMRKMCQPAWGNLVHSWPAGIDTEKWKPDPTIPKTIDVILYNKVRRDHPQREVEPLGSIRKELARRKLNVVEFNYGNYQPADYATALLAARAMIFVCEHETQGIAYQEALSCGVPLLAWDQGGEWLDPDYHPHRVRFGPVSSVPYWDERCGIRFDATQKFPDTLDQFFAARDAHRFNPRAYILENLTLEKSAAAFLKHAQAASSS